MKPSARLIHGPANSGKTERCLSAYLDLVQGRPEARAIYLCPTALAVAEVKERIVASGRVSAIAGPRVIEFYGLAQQVIRAARRPDREITPLAKTLLIKRIVRDLDKKGQLPYFHPIAEYPGFFQMVGAFIGELKMAARTPEEFARAIEARELKRPGQERHQEIASIYALYQKELSSRKLYDREGLLWIARDNMAAFLSSPGQPSPPPDIELLVVDGFPGFSPAELQIVIELAGKSRQTLVTLTYEKGESAGRHYQAVLRTHQLLAEAFRLTPETTRSADAAAGNEALGVIAENLFQDTAEAATAQVAASVEIIAAPGQLREVEEIAREIKRLLIAGDAGRPVRPDDVLVIFRDLAEYGDRTEEVFEQFGIPVHLQRDLKLCDSPLVKTLLAAVEAAASGGDRDAVLGFLRSSYVRALPEAERDRANGADHVASAAFRAGIIGGFDSWPKRLGRYRSRLEAQRRSGLPEGEQDGEDTPPSRDIEDLDRARALAGKVIEDLRNIPQRGKISEFRNALETLIEQYSMEAAVWRPTHDWTRRDVSALEQLREALNDADALFGGETMTLSDFSRLVHEISQSGLQLPPGRAEGRVRVMDAHGSRPLHFPIVFVGGLSERSFPRHHSEDAIWDDEQRRRLSEMRIPLPPRAQRTWDEMMLFYSAVTRATRKLYLTYPLSDSEGKEKLRSYFVDELRLLFAEEPKIREARLCDLDEILPEPQDEKQDRVAPVEAYRPRDLTNSMAYTLFQRRTEPDRRGAALYNHLLKQDAKTTQSEVSAQRPRLSVLLRAVAVENERESRNPYGPYDGVLDDAAIQAALLEKRRKGSVYSISQFNLYGRCPFQYFCQYLLKLEALEEPEEAIGALQLGTFYHNILYNFYTSLREQRKGATSLADDTAERLMPMMTAAAEREFARAVAEGRAPDSGKSGRDNAVWRLQKEKILRNLRLFVEKEIASAQKSDCIRRPSHFEIGFGPQGRGQDRASRQEPLEIEDADGPIRIRGLIDRVDLVGKANAVEGFIILDYKLRNTPNLRMVEQGLNFQLPVYIMAAQKVLFPKLPAIRAAFYSIHDCKEAKGIDCTQEEEWTALEDLVLNYIRRYVGEIAAGRFPVSPQGKCDIGGAPCPYCTICRHSESRQARKEAKRLHEEAAGPAQDCEAK